MSFSDPLARGAKLWPVRTSDGADVRTLVIVTTLVLDPDHKHFKQKLVDRLSGAARDYLATSGRADAYLLINRFRDWED